MATTYLQKLRLFSRDLRLYLISSALYGFVVEGIYLLLLNLYLLRLGYGPEFIGLFSAVGLLAMVVVSLPAGALSGRWGIRRMMIAGLTVCMVGRALVALAVFVPPSLRVGWLLATSSLGWLGAAVYIVNSDPFLAGATSSEDRAHAFSVQAALWPLFGFVGSLMGGLLPGVFADALALSLDDPRAYSYPLFLAVLALIPAVLVLLATREVSAGQRQEAATERGAAPYGLITLMVLVGILRLAGERGAKTFFNVYLDDGLQVSTAQIGGLQAIGQLLAVPAALAAPLLMARWGKERTVVAGALGVALSLLPLALIAHWGTAGLGFMGMVALASIGRSAFTLYSQEVVSPGWRAQMSGAILTGGALGVAAILFAGGHLIAALGYRSFFLLAAGLTAAGGLVFWAYFRVPRGALARASAPMEAT